MKTVYAALLGSVLVLMVVPLAAAKPPSWDRRIDTPSRFKVLEEFENAAVLDNETGLVWAQSPETQPDPALSPTWLQAMTTCNVRTVGGRFGWRLPTIQELATLLDPAVPPPGPTLPPGHPFGNVRRTVYWSATTRITNADHAYAALLGDALVGFFPKSSTVSLWCVRGGSGVDPQ